MSTEDDPRGVIWGLASKAQDEGRLTEFEDPPVRGISEIGANVDRFTVEHWKATLKGVRPEVRQELAKLHFIPIDDRQEFVQILMHVSGPDPGFNSGDWDVTQSFIDLLSANDTTLQTIARVVAMLDILT